MTCIKPSLKGIHAIVFDFDGVLAESIDVKTRAYALLFRDEGEEVVRKVIDFHLKNGGVSRFKKIRFDYDLTSSTLDYLKSVDGLDRNFQ